MTLIMIHILLVCHKPVCSPAQCPTGPRRDSNPDELVSDLRAEEPAAPSFVQYCIHSLLFILMQFFSVMLAPGTILLTRSGFRCGVDRAVFCIFLGPDSFVGVRAP